MDLVFLGTFDVNCGYIIAINPAWQIENDSIRAVDQTNRIKVKSGKYYAYCIQKMELNHEEYEKKDCVLKTLTNKSLIIIHEGSINVSQTDWITVDNFHMYGSTFGFFDYNYYKMSHQEELFQEWYKKHICDVNEIYNCNIDNFGCWLRGESKDDLLEVANDPSNNEVIAVRYHFLNEAATDAKPKCKKTNKQDPDDKYASVRGRISKFIENRDQQERLSFSCNTGKSIECRDADGRSGSNEMQEIILIGTSEYGDEIRYIEHDGRMYVDLHDYRKAKIHEYKLHVIEPEEPKRPSISDRMMQLRREEGLSLKDAMSRAKKEADSLISEERESWMNAMQEWKSQFMTEGTKVIDDSIIDFYCDFSKVNWGKSDADAIYRELENNSVEHFFVDLQYELCCQYDAYNGGDCVNFDGELYGTICRIMEHARDLTSDEFIRWILSEYSNEYAYVRQDDLTMVLEFPIGERGLRTTIYKGNKLSGEFIVEYQCWIYRLNCEDIPFKRKEENDLIMHFRSTLFGDAVRYTYSGCKRYYSVEDWEKLTCQMHEAYVKCADDTEREKLRSKIKEWDNANAPSADVVDEMFSRFDTIKWKRWGVERIKSELNNNSRSRCLNLITEASDIRRNVRGFTLKDIQDINALSFYEYYLYDYLNDLECIEEETED